MHGVRVVESCLALFAVGDRGLWMLQKPSTSVLFCFVLGVVLVKGGGISRNLGLFNVKKCETQGFKLGLHWDSLPDARGLECSQDIIFLRGLEDCAN